MLPQSDTFFVNTKHFVNLKKEKANGPVYFWSTVVFPKVDSTSPTSDPTHLSPTPRDSGEAVRMGTKADFHRKQGSQLCLMGRLLPLWSAAAGAQAGGGDRCENYHNPSRPGIETSQKKQLTVNGWKRGRKALTCT